MSMQLTDPIVRRGVSSAWSHLPLLAASGALVAVSGILGSALAGGLTPWLPLLVAVLSAGPVMGAASVADDVVQRGESGWRRWGSALRGKFARGLAVLCPPAMAVSLLVVADVVARQTDSWISRVPVLVSAIVSSVLLVALTAAVPTAAARPGLRPVRLWITAVHLVGRWPIRFLAAAVAGGLGVWASLRLTGTLLLLVPAPTLLLCSIAFWTCSAQLGASDLASTERTESQ